MKSLADSFNEARFQKLPLSPHGMTASPVPSISSRNGRILLCWAFGIPIPIPESVEEREVIVSELNTEQTLVAANRELTERMEKKIQAAIARVWGEEETEAE